MEHMTQRRHLLLTSFLAIIVWMSCNVFDRAGGAVVSQDALDVPQDLFWANLRTSQGLADFFEKRSNPRTGLSLSFYGDAHPISLYGTQIYDIGLRLLADSAYSQQIIDTFAKNSSSRATRDTPQTVGGGHVTATEGIFNWIRIEGFEQEQWWNSWEWSIKTGENAWLGKGALH